MVYNKMDDSVRKDVTEAAVMESLAENKTVERFYAAHPEKLHSNVTIKEILQFADNDKRSQDDKHMQILRHYFENEDGGGYGKESEYVIRDYDRTRENGKFNENWEANMMITTPGENGKEPGLYVSYRGTQKGEGNDNAEGMYMESTPQQREAREYFDSLVERNPENEALFKNSHVTVVGHSKGGNKAMFVTMTSKYGDYIDSCIALDAQGFSPEAVSYFKNDPSSYNSRSAKITLVAGKYDFVHALGIPIVNEGNLYYVDTEPNYSSKDLKDPLYSLHESEYLFQKDANGNFTSNLQKEDYPSEAVLNEKEFMKEFCEMSPEQRKEAGHTLMEELWGQESPDGKHLDQNWLIVFLGLMKDPVHSLKLISGTLLAAYPEIKTIGTILKVAKMLGMPVPTLAMSSMIGIAVFLFGAWVVAQIYSKYMQNQAEAQEEMIRKLATDEALHYPEFYIDPKAMLNTGAADAGGRIGNRILDVQTQLRAIAKESIPSPYIALPGVRGETFDPSELARLQKIKNNIAAKKKEIAAMQDDIQTSIQHLEQIKDTLNAVLSYMNDTGNEFINIESSIVRDVQSWGSAAKVGK